jgi:hypothetical protein
MSRLLIVDRASPKAKLPTMKLKRAITARFLNFQPDNTRSAVLCTVGDTGSLTEVLLVVERLSLI